MEVYLNQKRIKLNPKNAIGKGGEADVYDLKNGQVLKLFKTADHPDYQMLPQEQQAAMSRLALHQQKLRVFPQNLPARVIKPETLAMDKQGVHILGYAMPFLQNTVPLLKYSDRNYRQTNAISQQVVTNLFRDLHETVLKVHQVNVTIGDFNDLNLLVSQNQVHLIDADSFQFGQFPCQVFTARFVDPMLCDRSANQPILTNPHNPDSDWYAFTVMLMQSLLYVDPYGGVYKPKSQSAMIPHSARPLQRITIFHPDVRYPKPAIPYKILSDDLLQHFHNCFEKDWRGDFPKPLLESMRWTKCNQCGIEHLKTTCPICRPSPLAPLPQVDGNKIGSKSCKVLLVFQTEGVILQCSLQNNSLNYLYHANHEFKREDGEILISGELDANIKFTLFGKSTIVTKQGKAIALTQGQPPQAIAADLVRANSFSRYWIDQGQLLRDGKLGNEYIGDILEGQTQFWVGEKFGFGFYRAGSLSVAFTFDAKRSGICDRVQIPPIQGELIDANCVFSDHLCWFFTATQEQGKIIHRVSVLRESGELVSTLTGQKGDIPWLTNIHGGSAIANWLFVPTDEGIARVEVNNGQIMITKIFPETEPYVDSGCSLIVGSQGIYVIHSQKILQLQLS
jgi:tRNA A-37 threonylcarbamoyl transferase component Bud32